ncbi:hypothetical protein X797_007416 [Metarhizium robertsii]|uniref:HNH nuclease domain-containing protein n=2 Tax=Metarhizium robertsii TaxID=568076 RepID=A0A014QYF1_9HYPO|nr:hypothetical protein X797_007416 [Metarhizium robertsii]
MTLPSMAPQVPNLVALRADYTKAQDALVHLQMEFDELSRQVEPDLDPDQEQPEPDREASLQLATLGIELASQQKSTIQLERNIVILKREAGILQPEEAKQRLQELSQRFFRAGDELWRYQKKRRRFDPRPARLLDPRDDGLAECLFVLYKRPEGQNQRRRAHSKSRGYIDHPRPNTWRAGAVAYYHAKGIDHGEGKDAVWCHVSGAWHSTTCVKTVRIVPPLPDAGCIGEMLFGPRAQSTERPGNALFMRGYLKDWFDNDDIVIIPVNATERPITRWRIGVITNDIRRELCWSAPEGLGQDINGKELKFLGEKRPVARFLYFRFVMALVRIKDVKRAGWQDVWARFYAQRPFPTPGNYMRKAMIFALATHFEGADMKVVESWVADHGFESPLKMTDDEATEAARRVHVAMEAVTLRRLEERKYYEDSEEFTDSDSAEDLEWYD